MIFFGAEPAVSVVFSPWGYQAASAVRKGGEIRVEKLVNSGLMSGEMDLDFATCPGITPEFMAHLADSMSSFPPGRCALVIADRSMRSINLTMTSLPSDTKDLEKIAAWRLEEEYGLELSGFYYHIRGQELDNQVVVTVFLTPATIIKPFRQLFAQKDLDLVFMSPLTAVSADYFALEHMWPDGSLILMSFSEGTLTLARVSENGVQLWRTVRLEGARFADSPLNMKKLAMAWTHLRESEDLTGHHLAIIGEYGYFSQNAHIVPELTGMNPLIFSPSGIEDMESAVPGLACMGALKRILQ